MHVQVVNFNLEGISRTEYETVCNELAEAFAALPGLVSKHWLADEKNNTYGGVYIWETREAYDAFVNSELFAGVGANPALVNKVPRILMLLKLLPESPENGAETQSEIVVRLLLTLPLPPDRSG